MADNNSDELSGVNAGTDQGQAGTGEQSGGNDREARYRVERNEARAQVDQLKGQVTALQRAAVESALGEGVRAEAFWAGRGDAGLDGLLTDDGTVDVAAVGAAVQDVRERFGIVDGPRRPAPDRTQGQNVDGVDATVDADEAWKGAFAPRIDA
ncbi:hypothetical protein [Gordonia polyisoprenivorans]|uniref:hypothetical protein n=1 Tax=Gordonia polyisoprenivorans TaxID=84595 RepID=UPI001AD7DBB2|nr:hypothetical protein [Gordonia polyisoprenivorans]QTI67397.1 hypothetical protein J6U32_17505 [Gordonia polyisoprenivorans]